MRLVRAIGRAPGRLSWGVWLPVIRRMSDPATVGLTFDDGPTPQTTPVLVDILRQHNASATFFFTGRRVEAYPHLVEHVVQAGHSVYAHGWEHVRYDRQPRHRLLEDIVRTEDYLRQFRPTPRPYLVRPPYMAGFRKQWAHKALRGWDPTAQFAHWTLSPEDWKLAVDCSSRSELNRRCANAVQLLLKRRRLGGTIILLHEDPFDVDEPFNALVAPTLVPLLLRGLERHGLRSRSLDAFRQPPRWRGFVIG